METIAEKKELLNRSPVLFTQGERGYLFMFQVIINAQVNKLMPCPIRSLPAERLSTDKADIVLLRRGLWLQL